MRDLTSFVEDLNHSEFDKFLWGVLWTWTFSLQSVNASRIIDQTYLVNACSQLRPAPKLQLLKLDQVIGPQLTLKVRPRDDKRQLCSRAITKQLRPLAVKRGLQTQRHGHRKRQDEERRHIGLQVSLEFKEVGNNLTEESRKRSKQSDRQTDIQGTDVAN